MVERQGAARTKLLMAVVGGSAVVAMGGLSAMFGDGVPMDSPAVAAPVLPGPMTIGGTVTTTIAPSVLATEKAVVTHKAQPYKG
ncbi:hypothetical protein [Mycolicibacterium sp. P1-5]|uniref:hypothetical protein n=1 Tax=Mycolicibacterium sp. P1-5 TaxID=2024617 RepID=UPI0011EC5ED6|nr:hypothetical protein [Mycolicibacterium sp. P1-5]KAA0110767.1 hypothetical protein CIW47_07160 [Mycolicibacterium sp. P1-5]